MRWPVVLAVATLAGAGCLSADAPPEATVFATAAFEVEGSWGLASAAEAVEAMGYRVDALGTHGFITERLDGHVLYARGPDAASEPSSFSVGFRVDQADVCATPTYDEWVDALVERLAPLAAAIAADFETQTGWVAGVPRWEVTATDADGQLLRFPSHCGHMVACAGESDCEHGSRWQDPPPRPPEPSAL